MSSTSFSRHYGVVQPIMSQTRVAVYAGVTKRCVLVSPECKHRLIHLLGIEHLERYEQVEVIHREAGDHAEQLRFELRNDILQRILAEISQIHEGGNPCGKLDQLLLDELTLGLVLLLLVGELLFFILR